MPPIRLLAALFIALAATCAGPAVAQESSAPERAESVADSGSETTKAALPDLVAAIDQANKEIESGLVTDVRLQHWQARLPEIRSRAEEIAQAAQEKAQSRQNLLDALGPAPDDGTEPPGVRNQRADLQGQVDKHLTTAKRADVVAAQAQALLRRASEISRARFAGELTVRGPTPLDPRMWPAAGADLREAGARLADGLAAALTKETRAGKTPRVLAVAALIAALAIAGALLLRRWMRRSVLRRRDPAPSYLRCLGAAGLDTLFYLLAPVAASGLVLAYLDGTGVLEGLLRPVAYSTALALAFFFAARGLTRAVVASDAPGWRVLPLSDHGAVRLKRVLALTAAVFAVDILIVRTGRAVEVGTALQTTHHLAFGVLITLIIARLIRRDIWTDPSAEGSGRYERLRGWLIAGVAAFGFMSLVPVLFGYFELSRFFTTRLVLSVLLASLLLLLHAVVREAVAACFGGARSREGTSGDQTASMVQFWLGAALDVVVLTLGVVAALPLWGLPWNELWTWIASAAAGFRLGGIEISPLDILLAVLVFAVILGVTRAAQRGLDTRVLSRTRLDVGVRDSLRTFTGYLGLVVAGLAALSTAGLDFSNLAIVAGALSVGIGFGLQTIVNNFVSGLILLFERPIKVGDWVVVGAHEGTIRRIRVRSTEIDTFDRSTVIVPNADLISGAITNWTHGNRICRVIVPVRAPYGSNPRQVYDLLLACARANPYVLPAPAPYVLFTRFGENALEFELRVYARDTEYYLDVLSDLHFAVDAAFREAGITMPFPQRELHFKSAQEAVQAPPRADGASRSPPGSGPEAPDGE